MVHRAADGAWVVEGWGAVSVLPGATASEGVADWRRVVAAARALHAATASLVRPALLDQRTDPWAVADRAAWDEGPASVAPGRDELVARLRAALAAPASLGPAQLVHGDLTDNVLLAPGEPPGIIDVSPYWRPASYAEGIVVADALCWHGATAHLPRELGVPIAAVARGLLFRLLTRTDEHLPHDADRLQDEVHRYTTVLDALGL